MRKYILNIIALCAVLLTACSKDTVNYEHTNNAEVTFASASIKMPTITEANEGKVSVPLYRGNTKEAVSIAVKVQGGEGIFTPDKLQFDFAAGEAVANLDFTFDFAKLGGKPETITIQVENAEQLSMNSISKTSFVLVRQLTWEKVGTGLYYSDWYEKEWDQDIYKAQEGDFYMFDNCWVRGTDFSFFYNGTDLDWYTVSTGYNHSSYAALELRVNGQKIAINAQGNYQLILDVDYWFPKMNNGFFDYKEVFTFPAGFEF